MWKTKWKEDLGNYFHIQFITPYKYISKWVKFNYIFWLLIFIYLLYSFATKYGNRTNLTFIKERLMGCKQYANLRLYLNKKQSYCQIFMNYMTIIFCLVTILYKLKKIDQLFWNCNDKPINNLCNQKKTQTNVEQSK